MSKKLISVLVIVLALSVFTIGSVFAATAQTPVVKISGTTLSNNAVYTIKEGQSINVTADGASKLLYKIANEQTKIVNGSSTNLTIPTAYTNAGSLLLSVCSLDANEVQSEWVTVEIAVIKETNSNIPAIKVNGATLSEDKVYTIKEGQNINVVANGASKILYKIANEQTKMISGSSTNLTIPTAYTNTGSLLLSVCSLDAKGAQSEWVTVEIAVVKEAALTNNIIPVIKVNGTTLSDNKVYTIKEGQSINVTASGASKLLYKLANEQTKTVSGSSTNITVPTAYTNTGSLLLSVCSLNANGVQSKWVTVELAVIKEIASTNNIIPVIKVNGTVLSDNKVYTISQGQSINVTANGASKVLYKIANEQTKTVTGSTANITIPAAYTNTGSLLLTVSSIDAKGVQSKWVAVELAVVAQNAQTNNIVPVVKINNTILTSDKEYIISQGKNVYVNADGASKIIYRVGNQQQQVVSGTVADIVIPDMYIGTRVFSLDVCCVDKNGVQSKWITYYLSVEKNVIMAVQPTVNVKVSNATLSEGTAYTIEQGQVIQIATTNAAKVYYKIGNETTKTVNSANVSLTMPTTYTDAGTIPFSVLAESADGVQTAWQTYYLNIKKDENTVDGVISVTVNGKVLTTDKTHLINEGKELNIQVENANRIYYKIGNSYTESIVGTKGTIVVPEKYTNAGVITLSVSAVLADGKQTNWKVYYLNVENSLTIIPNVELKVGNATLKTNNRYIIEEGQEIGIYANNASKVVYQIGNSTEVIVNSLNTTITIPTKYTNTGDFELKVATINANGVRTAWKIFEIEVRDGITNGTYPFLILEDEKVNPNLTGLNISLRALPLTTKTGNMNYFLLRENIQYNIDFVNASKTLTDKVTIEFVIPDGFDVTFVDTKGATKVNDNTLRWTFDGMEKGEKGTIPVTLYYTAYASKNNIAKPYATIKSGRLSDTSAVVNLVAKNASTEIATKHEPFMFGDAGTNTFRPNDGMNRAEVATLLTRILDLKIVTDYEVTYKDAEAFKEPQYAWATDAIMTVTKYGLMEGYDDGTFRPGAKITKAQLITILARAFDMDSQNTENSAFAIKDEPIKLFDDLSVVYSSYGYAEHWAAKYLAQMIRLNILPEFANTEDGNLDLVITRAEAAKLFCTVLYRGPAVDITNKEALTNDFKDITEYTSDYEYILEATADKHNSIYQKNGWEKITD